jgi:iron complex transport system ATP-binding protein
MSALEINGLSAWHHNSAPVLHDISFCAESGKITAILGPNGAGKSTVLKAVTGLVQCTGSIELNGSTVFDLNPKERAKRMAYVPQRSSLRAGLNVQRVVELGRYAHWEHLRGFRHTDREIVANAMKRARVAHLAERRFNQLSGGEQQRVLLARAIATGARTLLLDEPTSALDVYHSLIFRDLLKTLRDESYTVVIVLHDLNEAFDIADSAVLMAKGTVIDFGPITKVLSEESIFKAYRVRAIERPSLRFELESA